MTLSSLSFTIVSPRFTDWLAVGCETPSLFAALNSPHDNVV
jgi:hypothetical protein